MTKPHSRHRDALLGAQSHICACCGMRITSMYDATVDHVIPMVMGGSKGIGNIVAVHRRCNHDKAGRYPNGCELLWLEAVNFRLGADTYDVHDVA